METYIVGKIIIQTMRDIWYTVFRANLKVCFFLIKYKEHSDSFQKEQLWNSRNISLEQYHSSFCPRGGSQRHLSTHFTTVNTRTMSKIFCKQIQTCTYHSFPQKCRGAHVLIILILTENISQCFRPHRQDTGRDPVLRALASVPTAEDVQSSGGEEGIVGSLNTVLLCGQLPKCFSECAWVTCNPELQQTTHTRGSFCVYFSNCTNFA